VITWQEKGNGLATMEAEAQTQMNRQLPSARAGIYPVRKRGVMLRRFGWAAVVLAIGFWLALATFIPHMMSMEHASIQSSMRIISALYAMMSFALFISGIYLIRVRDR